MAVCVSAVIWQHLENGRVRICCDLATFGEWLCAYLL
jgi:hypothetical protein